MAGKRARAVCLLFAVLLLLLTACQAKRRRSSKFPSNKQLALQQREKSPASFAGLVFMRLVYGLAKVLGLQDNLSEAFNGAFVPPGEDDYGDFDFGGGEGFAGFGGGGDGLFGGGGGGGLFDFDL